MNRSTRGIIMGFLLNAIGIGLVVVGAKKIKHDAEEEKRRKNTVCRFDNISKEEFNIMVRRGGKGIKRLTNLCVKDAIVYGTVRSQSGLSDWNFKIDFNDYGKLTGTFWLSTDNDDSEIPVVVANRIAQQIKDYSNGSDDVFAKKLHYEDYEEDQEELRNQINVCCPYCGKQNHDKEARFCMYCGRRFRA